MIKVLLADDQELVLFGFSALISAEDDLTVVGEASNGAEAIDLALSTNPDIVLMDIRMPVLDGIEATRRMVDNPGLTNTRIVVLTTFDIDQLVYDALKAGASGFLLKDIRPEQLLEAIRIVHRGDSLLSPTITRKLIDEFISSPKTEEHTDLLSVLTARELEVLTEVGHGSNNDEIAETLFISPLTAKTHVSRIITKLNLRDRTQLVVTAYETGLVRAGESTSNQRRD